MAATVFAAAVVGTASPKFAAVDARRRRTGDGRFAGELDFLSNGIKPVELEGGFVALILPVEHADPQAPVVRQRSQPRRRVIHVARGLAVRRRHPWLAYRRPFADLVFDLK